jgi:large subunit ribosomal protein L6e
MAKTRKVNERGQLELAAGVMRFSAARMYHKKGLWAKKAFKKAKSGAKVETSYVIKKVNGAQNGKERKVLKVKPSRRLDEARMPKLHLTHKRKTVANHKLRKSLTPGTVVILLAGRHKGKRVVFLEQLSRSGLLLVSGPMKMNNVPLRRISPAYVIATKTKLDVSKLKLPEHINDAYFKREAKPRRQHSKEGEDIFADSKKPYVVSQQRKDDQKTVDSVILDSIRASKDKKMLFGYLGSKFSLRRNDAPHKMIF